MTRIAVNMLWCRHGRVGGSEQYLVRQLLGLHQASNDEFDVDVFAPRGFASAHPQLASVVSIHESKTAQNLRPLRVLSESTWLASRARGAHLVHHGGGTVPARSPQPALLTIHDLQYLVYPQYFSRVKLAYLSLRLPASAKRARHIVVPSEYVRSTVIDRLGVQPADVSVVRHGIEAGLGSASTSEQQLRARFGLTAAHVLAYPAVTHPHKNHLFLCDLVAGPLRNRDVQVVCAGGQGRGHEALQRRIAESGLSDRVKLVGRLNDADRDGLLAMAAALVFPSSYEGFGAPVIEAMALGAPVIASNLTALPEVVADAGQVLTLDAAAWAAAVDHAIANREHWRTRGAARAAMFRTVDSGGDLAVAYRKTLGERA